MERILNREFRYERKFLVPELTKSEIEAVVMSNSFMFREIFYERQVNNIYFDTLDSTSYFDNVLGNSDRMKVRIRWYGDDFNLVKKPVLELKIRRGFVGTKLSFPLNDFKFPISLGEMMRVFEKSGLPDWLMERLRGQRFSLLNSYKRKYFLSACGKFRITVDTNLTFGGVLNQMRLEMVHPFVEDFCIVELKYDVGKYAENVATQFPFRLTKSSKFVMGVSHFRGE